MKKLVIVVAMLVAGTALGVTRASTSVGTPVAATGVIIAVPGAGLADGDTLTIDDGLGQTVVFEFDSNAVVSAGGTPIAFIASDSATAISQKILNAINDSDLQITAESNGAAVFLTHDVQGLVGNVPIQESVANPDFTVIGLSGGADIGSPVGPSAATGLIAAVPGAGLADGDTFTVDDGLGQTVVFEFDSNAVVSAAGTPIAFSASDSATTISQKILNAINESDLQISAENNGAVVFLTHHVEGVVGNVPIQESVANPDFTVIGLSGGADAEADVDPPTDQPVVSGTSGDNGWYTTDVSVAWDWSDTGSGIDPANCIQTSVTNGEGEAVAASSSCQDMAGNPASDSITFPIDKTAPIVSVTGVTDGAHYAQGSLPVAGCSTTDVTSGVATEATVTVTGGSSGFGEFTATCSGGVNNAGLQAEPVSVSYSVTYTFTGFFQPIDMGVTNAAKAGRAIPVKFSLGGNFGLDIFALGYPRTVLSQCITGQAIDQIEETVTAGSDSLSYDAVADQYIYVWKTDKSWGGSCRELQVKTADGETHTARFTFSK